MNAVTATDPRADHQAIVHRLACHEFPFDFTRALEFALFRTFCVPSIARLLDRTGEFTRHAQKRYDDTDLLISEFVEWGYDSERGRAAIARINAIHGHFRIDNDDFRYVLSTFVFEPIRWIERYGHRPLTPPERLALFYFWRELGQRMGIRSVPEDYDAFERFNIAYERANFRFTDASARVGAATREMFVRWFPRGSHALVRRTIYALLDDRVVDAFGFPRPARLFRRMTRAALRWRGRISGWLPARTRPRLRTALRHRTYRDGYDVSRLGPSYLSERHE